MKRHFNDMQIGSIELFCLAAEHKSFTIAAAEAGVTPTAVSRSIGRLESRMGVKLFSRTTRRVNLTDAGQQYFEQCSQALAQLIDAEQCVMGRQNKPAGLIRISLPVTYGHIRIFPLLTEFKALYPDVLFDVNLSNRNVDFIGEGYDISIRVRQQPDSSLIARHFEDLDLIIIASPKYLSSRPIPRVLEDLAYHDCIQFKLPSTGINIPWIFNTADGLCEVNTKGSFRCSEDLVAGVTLAVNGAGLFQSYRLFAEEDIKAGRLVEVLKDYSGATRPYTILYPGNKLMPLRLRVFIDFLISKRDGNLPGK